MQKILFQMVTSDKHNMCITNDMYFCLVKYCWCVVLKPWRRCLFVHLMDFYSDSKILQVTILFQTSSQKFEMHEESLHHDYQLFEKIVMKKKQSSQPRKILYIPSEIQVVAEFSWFLRHDIPSFILFRGCLRQIVVLKFFFFLGVWWTGIYFYQQTARCSYGIWYQGKVYSASQKLTHFKPVFLFSNP